MGIDISMVMIMSMGRSMVMVMGILASFRHGQRQRAHRVWYPHCPVVSVCRTFGRTDRTGRGILSMPRELIASRRDHCVVSLPASPLLRPLSGREVTVRRADLLSRYWLGSVLKISTAVPDPAWWRASWAGLRTASFLPDQLLGQGLVLE